MYSIHGNQQLTIFNQIETTCCVCLFWLNSDINIGSMSVMYKDRYKKRVNVSGYLMDSNYTLLNKTAFEDKFIYQIFAT